MVETSPKTKSPRLSQNDAIYTTKKSFKQMSRRKSEPAINKLKLDIPPHHLEPRKNTNVIPRNETKSGNLILSKNVSFLRRPKEYWFVLNCDLSYFAYYKSRQEHMLGYNIVGFIDISKCSILIDPEVRGQFILSENRFKSYKLIANSDTERASWIQAIQLQRDYWNKSKKPLEKMKHQKQLTLSDSHNLTNSFYRDPINDNTNSNIDRSPISPKSARKFFSRQFSGDDYSFKERSSSLGRSYSQKPFTVAFRKSGSKKVLYSPNKAESVENIEVDTSNELITPSPYYLKSPSNDLTRSVSFDTMRKPSPLPSPRVGASQKEDTGLIQDTKGDTYVKYSTGYFLDEDLSDEEMSLDYSNQPSTLIGAQLIIRNCQRDLREAKREIEKLKSREVGYKELLKHRDDQLLTLEEQVEEIGVDKLRVMSGYTRQNSAHSRMVREMQETQRQLEQEKRDKSLMSVEVQNLEKLVFKKDADMQLASDRYDDVRNTLKMQRDRHLQLIGYAMTHILGNRHLIVPEFIKDSQMDIQEYSLEEKLHRDVAWLWRLCRYDDPSLPDLNDDEGTFEDQHGDTLEPSQDDPASILDAVRYLTGHLNFNPSPVYYHIPFKEKKEMKRLVRKGLPDMFRKSVWMYAIRLQVNIIRKAQSKNLYEQLVQEALANGSRFSKDIDLDLYRTFPSNIYFREQDKSLVPALRRVLLAYSLFDPKIGYCQGMNMLAGTALHVLPEEEAFWCLVTILQKLMPENYFSGSLLGAIADQMVLSDLIKEKLPRLGRHMDNFGIEPHLICLNWFITVFADVMPTDMVLKIWDTFLLDGRKSIFRYAIAILHLHEHFLLMKEDPILLHNYIRTVCSHWIDFELLRNVAFTKFRTFPKTAKLDEQHKAHLQPLIFEHEKKERKLQKKKPKLPISHSGFSTPKPANYAPTQPKTSTASQKSRSERSWGCGTVLPVSNHGYLLCAGDRTHTSLYIVTSNGEASIEDKYSCHSLDFEIGGEVCCMIEVSIFWIIGTSNGWLYGIDRTSQQVLWKSELKETPLCLFSKTNLGVDRLFLGLANGKLHSFTLQGLPTKLQDGLTLPELFPADTVIVGLGNEPISCLESPGDGIICCGVGGRICVFETETTQQLYEMIVSSEKRRSIREMRRSKHGLWLSLKGSCNILLYKIEPDSHSLIYRIDYNCFIQPPSVELVKSSSSYSTLPLTKKDARATSLLARDDELWIGTHNGNLLVFDVKKEEKDVYDLVVPKLDHSASLFQFADEYPIDFVPGSGEGQVVTKLCLSTVEKISTRPVRVLLDCVTQDNTEVLSASGALGDEGSVRMWDNTASPKVNYTLPIKPFEDSPLSEQCNQKILSENGFEYCGIFFSSETENDKLVLSPIDEQIIAENESSI